MTQTGQISKLIFAITVSISAIKSMSFLFLGLSGGLALFAFLLWGGRFFDLIKFIKFLILLGLFIFLLHLFGHKGNELFRIWIISATTQGAILGLKYLVKLIIFGITALIILKTIDPFELIQPIETISHKLGSLGRFLAKGALAFSLALRFIPDIIKQAKLTISALKSRGIDFEGGLFKKAKTASLLTATVFVAAFKKSEKAALSLSVKGYPGRYRRAVFPKGRFSFASILTLIVSGDIKVPGSRVGKSSLKAGRFRAC
jgi:energy-coupling factor transporter transmembrane protein EcfT